MKKFELGDEVLLRGEVVAEEFDAGDDEEELDPRGWVYHIHLLDGQEVVVNNDNISLAYDSLEEYLEAKKNNIQSAIDKAYANIEDWKEELTRL